MKNTIIWKESLDSTNNEVKRLSGMLENHTVIAAKRQTSGRGQADHKWQSEAGANLTFTLLHRPSVLDIQNIASINHAVCTAIIHYLSDKGVAGRIKWPNDIWVEDKKICGLLIENTVETGRVKESVIGVGFNLNQSQWPAELPNPVSLKELCPDASFFPEIELASLSKEICRRLDMIESLCGRVSLQEEFEKYVFRLQTEA